MHFEFDKDKYYKWVLRWTLVLCIYICYLFVSRGYYNQIHYLAGLNRIWGRGLIPGFPTNVVIPLCFGLFLTFYTKKNIIIKLLVTISTFLIPSRTGQVITLLIWLYYYIRAKEKTKMEVLIIGLFAALGVFKQFDMITFIEEFSKRYALEVNADRFDIILIASRCFLNSPVVGYGGNTLDSINSILGNMSLYGTIWPHTHNWILENIVRYGLVGCLLFCTYMFLIYKELDNKEIRYFFLLMLIMALTQTYMQNFVFMFIMYSIVDNRRMDTKRKRLQSSRVIGYE